jgi:hypothetical protein
LSRLSLPRSGVKHEVRLAVHECGCVVEYATDRHGEYPLEINGCAVNDRMFEEFLADRDGERNTDFVSRVKAHRGREIA